MLAWDENPRLFSATPTSRRKPLSPSSHLCPHYFVAVNKPKNRTPFPPSSQFFKSSWFFIQFLISFPFFSLFLLLLILLLSFFLLKVHRERRRRKNISMPVSRLPHLHLLLLQPIHFGFSFKRFFVKLNL